MQTRSKVEDRIYGVPEELAYTVLPTVNSVINYCIWIQNDLAANSEHQKNTMKKSIELSAKRVEDIWRTASIPIITHQSGNRPPTNQMFNKPTV